MVGSVIHIAIAERQVESQVESRKLRHLVFGGFVPQAFETYLDH